MSALRDEMERVRPGQEADSQTIIAATTPDPILSARPPICDDLDAVAAREAWAARMLSGVPRPIPRFVSPEWLALAEGDRRKVAGVVVAASCYARDGDNLESNLRAELAALRQAGKESEDADYQARRDAHRAAWTGKGFRIDPVLAAQEVEAEYQAWIEGAA